MTNPRIVLYSTRQVCAMTGASYRQLDLWARNMSVVPVVQARGSGTQRRYLPAQVFIARVAVLLSALGAGWDVLAAVSAWLDRNPRAMGLILVTVDGEVRKIASRQDMGTGWLVDLTAERKAMSGRGVDRLEAVG